MAEGKTRVRYVGPHDAVEVTDGEGTVHIVERNREHGFPADDAKGLLEQAANWQPASKSSKSSKDEGG